VASSLSPCLKTLNWCQTVAPGVFCQPLFFSEQTSEHSLAVVYGIDAGESLEYLGADNLQEPDGCNRQEIALANLRRELSTIDWQSIPIECDGEPEFLWHFSGSFYAAEVVLLKERLQELHRYAVSSKLLICAPRRGELLALPYHEENATLLERFVTLCYERFYEGDNEPLSPCIYEITAGEVTANLKVDKEFEDYCIRKFSQSNSGGENVALDEKDTIEQEESNELLIYTPFQIVLASLFGTFFAGFLALFLNAKRINDKVAQQGVLLLGGIAVGGLFSLFSLLPKTSWDRLFPFASALLMFFIASFFHKKTILLGEYKKVAIRRLSFLKVFGVIVVSWLILIVTFSFLIGVVGINISTK